MRSSPNTHLMTHRIPFDTLCPGQAGLGPPNQRPPMNIQASKTVIRLLVGGFLES